MENITDLKKDIELIKNKIKECRDKNITKDFDIEMVVMTDLPEQFNQYPWLIKRLCKSNNDEYLEKFVNALESVAKGESTLASVELKLGEELKNKFFDPILEKNKQNN